MNSSRTPPCVLIPRVKTGRTKKSLKVNGTALNERLLLRSVEVFWDASMSITCPNNEFNGNRVRIYDKRTSYGVTSREFSGPQNKFHVNGLKQEHGRFEMHAFREPFTRTAENLSLHGWIDVRQASRLKELV